MVKKLNFRGHFQQSRHFETKQNSTFLKTGGYRQYIKVVFFAKFEENPRCSFSDICVFVKPDFCKSCSNFISIGEEGASGSSRFMFQTIERKILLKKNMFDCSFAAYRKIAAYKCKNFLVFQNVILWKT
jgi:hypothetical protein